MYLYLSAAENKELMEMLEAAADEDADEDEATPHEVGHNIYILAYQVKSGP